VNKLHANLLTARLEEILNAGMTCLLWNELYRWYGVQKIAAGTLRDLDYRWDELTDGQEGRLMKIDGPGGVYLVSENSIAPLFSKKVDEA